MSKYRQVFDEAGERGVLAPVERREGDLRFDMDQPVGVGVNAEQAGRLRHVGLDLAADVDGVGAVPVVLQCRGRVVGRRIPATAPAQGDAGHAEHHDGRDHDGETHAALAGLGLDRTLLAGRFTHD
jgi:hypothetical protein